MSDYHYISTEQPEHCPKCGSPNYKLTDYYSSIYAKHIDVWTCKCGFEWIEEYAFKSWKVKDF